VRIPILSFPLATPPLPDEACVRVKLDYTQTDGFLGGSRFYIAYSGSAPTGGNLNTLAGDIETAWVAQLAPIINDEWSLTEVDCQDIATDSGASGFWTGSEAGSASGTPLPAQVAATIEYDIARRYRGGKPRMYLPPPVTGSQATAATWSSGYQSSLQASVADFFAAIAALTIGSMGTLSHINLSYYQGYTNVEIPGRRARSIPTYRSVAKSDAVTGYAAKLRMSSQKRRRSSTTP
jgi:hypothetical protein